MGSSGLSVSLSKMTPKPFKFICHDGIITVISLEKAPSQKLGNGLLIGNNSIV